ncbi:MAG: hypothetical protein PF692_06775 [Kiritimatiellae bacterium]|jgi:Ca2+/Na+ antiporter|nr:hypothetical protein [Kiritimatiellia bacterium]
MIILRIFIIIGYVIGYVTGIMLLALGFLFFVGSNFVEEHEAFKLLGTWSMVLGAVILIILLFINISNKNKRRIEQIDGSDS